MMDASQYSSRNSGLSLHQLLQIIEEEDLQEGDIYMAPPVDGEETDQDSDLYDDENEANVNHLGPATLRTECVFEPTQSVATLDSDDDFSSEDDMPLSIYLKSSDSGCTSQPQKKFKMSKSSKREYNWQKSDETNFKMNKTCDSEETPVEKKSPNATPVDFFKLFFDQELVSTIVEQTNLYAHQKNLSLNLTENELFVTFGDLLLSGYGKYPNKRMYWSSDNDVPKILSESIRLHKFEAILKHLHLNDNSKLDSKDKLYKLRPLISKLNRNFREFGGVDENLSIDESMIPYYGKHYAKQFIKGKPIRFGFKNWALCTSNGYMLAFEIYTGKGDDNDVMEDDFGVGGNVVLKLINLAKIPARMGYKIFFDNYFTSIHLLKKLAEEGYCATGTIRENRLANCPLKNNKKNWKKEKRGEYDYRLCEDVIVFQWKDNKIVTMASNFGSTEIKSAIRYSREARAKVSVQQPLIYQEYNQGMGGVDKMFDAAVVNSWLLMRKIYPKDPNCKNLLSFRRYVSVSFLKTHGVKSKKGQVHPPVNLEARYDKLNHLIEYHGSDRRCGHCGKKSQFICSKCDIGLHPKYCFISFHTQQK